MTEPTLSKYFIHKSDEVKLSLLWRISEQTEENVRFAPAWGGLVRGVDQKTFDADFVQVPQETIDKLMRTFEPAAVSCDQEDDVHMNGFVNGQNWNGWLIPYFTREVIEAEMEDDGFLSPVMIGNVEFFFEGDDFYELSPLDGESFPSDFDLNLVKAIIRASSSPEELETVLEKVGVICSKSEPLEIMVEGTDEPICVYTVGDGWTWVAVREPDSAPSSPMM